MFLRGELPVFSPYYLCDLHISGRTIPRFFAVDLLTRRTLYSSVLQVEASRHDVIVQKTRHSVSFNFFEDISSISWRGGGGGGALIPYTLGVNCLEFQSRG